MSTVHVTLTNGERFSVEQVDEIDLDNKHYLILEGGGKLRGAFANCAVSHFLLESTKK